MFMKLDVIKVMDNSSIIMGHFSETKTKGKVNPPSFFTLNLMHIDLLKRITKIETILNQKYCDIDSTFGLHDYTVIVDVRNQRQTFFSETFRKVFTKAENIEEGGKRRSMHRGPRYADFWLIRSEKSDFGYSGSYRFEGMPFY